MKLVGTPFLSSPAKRKSEDFTFSMEARDGALPSDFADAEGDAFDVESALGEELEESVEGADEITSLLRTGRFETVGIELKPKNAKNTRMRERAALLDFFATSAAFL